MLSEKYLAGFLDSDGCIYIQWLQEGWRPQLRINFTQEEQQDKVIYMIHEEYGGYIKTTTIKGKNYTGLDITGKHADMLLNRIKKHLVVKRRYADICLGIVREKAYNIPELKQRLKVERQIQSFPLPNYPSRKWLAGYIDGDGCISTHGMSKSGAARVVLHIACSNYDTEGIELLHKAYGGGIFDMSQGRCKQWTLVLHPSKAKEVFEPIAKYMIVKQDQAKFILGCAAMGHYRDGEGIKAALRQLKASPHRLNELGDYRSERAAKKELVAKSWGKRGLYPSCIVCGSTHRRHEGGGLCSCCYQRDNRSKSHAIVGQP